MARQKTPDGRRVTMCLKLSEPEAARVDRLRGKLSRGAWLRAAVLAATEPSETPPQRKRSA